MFGFFAFNGGSRASLSRLDDGLAIATAATNTMLSGAAAAMVVLLVHKWRPTADGHSHKWSLLLTINAALAGMVAACAGADVLRQWAAVVVGCGAGVVYYSLSILCVKIKLDDPLDATAGKKIPRSS